MQKSHALSEVIPRRAKAVSWHFARGIKALSLEFKSGLGPVQHTIGRGACVFVKGFLAQRMGRIALREMLGFKVTLLKVGLVIF